MGRGISHWRVSLAVLESAKRLFDRPLICFSGGKDSTLLVYLASKVLDEAVVLIGSPYPLPGELEHCYRVLKELGVDWKAVEYRRHVPSSPPVENGSSVEECCHRCKTEALLKIAKERGCDCVVVGVRWDEHPDRSGDCYIYERAGVWRVEPLLHWSWKDVLSFYKQHPGLLNPLYLEGYTSLGCWPCTAPNIPPQESVEAHIDYILKHPEVRERGGRRIDKEEVMGHLRKLGYF